jgi:predicted N-acetyltransferase YhbS
VKPVTTQLREIPAEHYAREILPQTAKLWAGRRDFDTYVTQTLEIARGGYGRRHYRTFGLYDEKTLVASFKRYERILHDGPRRLHAIGIGAVYTPDSYRGRGYASVMLASALDRARADGYDLAYLFSDIRPQFYEPLGFRELASREISLRADTLPAQRIELAHLADSDWSGVRRCFDLCARRRPFGFTRTPLVWEWIRMRIRHGSEHTVGSEANLVARRGRGVAAYVLGVRAPELDAYVLDELGFADDDAALMIPSLLRAAAGDLRRIVGWLPPSGARDILPKGSVRKRRDAVWMMAALTSDATKLVESASRTAAFDGCWSTDHI